MFLEEYTVYRHINRLNGKQYIGLTKQKPENRWGVNGINYRGSCPHFWNAIKKDGWDNFDHIIVAEKLSKEDACKMEMQLIKKYHSQDNKYGYNIYEGGTAPSMPKETRKKLSIALQNNKNGYGHPCSEEKKKKISMAQKGKKLSNEHKLKLSEAKRGKSHPPPSKETRKKISDAHRKSPVYCEETSTIYESIQECARQLKLSATSICACCKGKHSHVKGYHIRYANNNTINA